MLRQAIGSSLVAVLMMGAADGLSKRYRAEEARLRASPFGRPLLLESAEREGRVRGDVVARLERPFDALRLGLDTPAEWCDVLILHLNVQSCAPTDRDPAKSLALAMGRKGVEPGEAGQSMELDLRVGVSTPGHFEVELSAASGPAGTTDFRITLEAIPVEQGRSFLRLEYGYSYGAAARLALSTYLRTVGRDKVGFSLVRPSPGDEPRYVRGFRGALERNVMRYFLAIDTYLASADRPADRRRAWRLDAWFDATERYPRQLHELSKAEYLAAKQGAESRSRPSEPRSPVQRARTG